MAAHTPEIGLVSLVEVCTNTVAWRESSGTATVHRQWLLRGASDDGFWIETETPFFRIGTNPVTRAFVGSCGTISFGDNRRLAPVAEIPEPGTDTALAPFCATLGVVPESRWNGLPSHAPSRFFHEPLDGGGMLFSWENVLVDRDASSPIRFQAELRPNGDFLYRYDIPETSLSPTNFVIGAQIDGVGIEALRIAFGEIRSADVFRVSGQSFPNAVPTASFLCTNGLLRTGSRFELRWKNVSAIESWTEDSDDDGLSNHDEVFLHGTNPFLADTDADGIVDGNEIRSSSNPLDADENNDGIPDGVIAVDWEANPLWAENSSTNACQIVISMTNSIPEGTKASLLIDDLCIPLQSPGSWTLGLIPGELYSYRLDVHGDSPVDLSIASAIGMDSSAERLRSQGYPMSSPPLDFPFWQKGNGNVFNGLSNGGNGFMCIPKLTVEWIESGDGSHVNGEEVCLHGGNAAHFSYSLEPEAMHESLDFIDLAEGNGLLILPVSQVGVTCHGIVVLPSNVLRFGSLLRVVSAHRCDATEDNPFCSICGHYEPLDISVSVRSSLTLKHDNQSVVTIVHPNSSGVSFGSGTIEIRRKGDDDWLILGSESTLAPWTAKIAGTFELRGRVIADGREVTTRTAEVEVRFPCYDQIVSDTDLQQRLQDEWIATILDTTPAQRRERGFWVWLNTISNCYEAGEVILGEYVGNDDGASIDLPDRPSDMPNIPSATSSGARYPIASFHAHTPTFYREEGRAVGPSISDNQRDFESLVPGIVYDYIGQDGDIEAHHPVAAPAGLWKSLGLERRPTP